MKFKRIQFPAKSLIVSSLDARYNTFALYFLKLWTGRFGTNPDFSGDSLLASALSRPNPVPQKFFACLGFIWREKYRTIVFLNPDTKADRPLKWAARLLFVKNRAGFAPLRGVSPLNYSLPFNTENHHYVHQLKIFFEYLVGEKIPDWKKPEIASLPAGKLTVPAENYGVIAIDAGNPATGHLIDQFAKFINHAARQLHLVLSVSAPEKTAAQELTRSLSKAMTERAIAVTHLVVNPGEPEKLRAVRDAVWATGSDAETLNFAALAGVPSLSIFGPLNERIWQPFATRSRVLAGDFSCRPCTKYPGKVECTNPVSWQCISGVTAELLSATLNGMLSRQPRSRNET